MFTALLVSVALSQQPYFELHSGVWQNLHHVLFELARRQRVEQGAELWGPPPFDIGPGELSPEDAAVWKRAVAHYAKTWAEKDLLFDDDLYRIKGLLSAHESDAELKDPDIPADTLKALNEAAAIYRKDLWPKHDAANHAWFKEREKEVSVHGPAVVKLLETAFGAPFPKTPIRVDVVAVGNWGGAYTTTTPAVHIVASSLDPRDQGRPGTEILFHETAHAMTDALETALGPTAPKGLWHAVLFYTVGEAFRRQWPDYVPYAEAQGVYTRGWDAYLEPIKQHWAPRLDGQGSLQGAADKLNKALGAPDPDVALGRAQTVITGTRTERRLEDAVVPIEVITRSQIEAIGARNLEQLLLQQPGVEMEYSFRGAGVSLQGLGPEYVLVLVDGERQTGRFGNTLDLTRYSLRDVERIEIIKGPAAALYGSDAIGGVINLIARRPTKRLELLGRLQGGLSNAPGTGIKADVIDARVHAATRLDWFEARAGAGWQSYGAYDWNPRDVATSGAGFTRWDADLALAANLSDKARLSAKTDYLRRDVSAVDIPPSGEAVFDRRQRSEQFNASVRADVTPLPTTRIALWGHLALFRDQLQQDQRGAAFEDRYTASLDRLYSVDAQVDHQTGEHTVTVGAQFLAERLFSSRISQLGERYRVGVFAQDEWDVKGLEGLKVKLLPGVRLDVDSQFGSAPTPRLAVKLDPHPAITLRASYGWGFRAPSFQELYLLFENTSVGYVVEGNPRLKAETSQGLNVAADVRLPLVGWVASASLFHTSLTNLINIDTGPINPINPTRFRYDNVAAAYAQGLEASLRMRLSRGAYFDLAYVLTDARDTVRNAPLVGRAMHKLSAQLAARYRPTGLEAVVRATLLGPRPFNEDRDGDGRPDQTPVMVNLDIQLTWRPFTWGSVFGGVTNLLNMGDADYVPQPPRRFTAGVQLEY